MWIYMLGIIIMLFGISCLIYSMTQENYKYPSKQLKQKNINKDAADIDKQLIKTYNIENISYTNSILLVYIPIFTIFEGENINLGKGIKQSDGETRELYYVEIDNNNKIKAELVSKSPATEDFEARDLIDSISVFGNFDKNLDEIIKVFLNNQTTRNEPSYPFWPEYRFNKLFPTVKDKLFFNEYFLNSTVLVGNSQNTDVLSNVLMTTLKTDEYWKIEDLYEKYSMYINSKNRPNAIDLYDTPNLFINFENTIVVKGKTYARIRDHMWDFIRKGIQLNAYNNAI